VVPGVAALVTSATGDEGSSDQLAQLSSLHATKHFVGAIIVRGSPLRSARETPINRSAYQDRFASRPTLGATESLAVKSKHSPRVRQSLAALRNTN